MVGAYGWPGSVAGDRLELRAWLAALHGEISGGAQEYRPFKGLVPQRLQAVLGGLRPGAHVTLGLYGRQEVEGEVHAVADDAVTLVAASGEVIVPVEDVCGVLLHLASAGPE